MQTEQASFDNPCRRAGHTLAPAYFNILHIQIGPFSLLHWINDALMALFFLMVGLEIKREMLDGQLSSWSHRLLPGGAALAGMVVPALIYAFFNASNPATAHGWAIPAATDIAFALGVLSLLGSRVPVTLKVFLMALAIIDDLGAVLIIALFYNHDLDLLALGGAVIVMLALIWINRRGVKKLLPYLALGLLLWVLALLSGIHPTIAGVLVAMSIPITLTPGAPEARGHESPLHRLEHALQRPVSFMIVPLFGFANAGLSFAGIGLSTMTDPVTLGVGLGLLTGKVTGVFGAVVLMVKMKWVSLPGSASWLQMFGVALLCGVGFTMSLFVGLLAFGDPSLQDRAKLGIIVGSSLAGLIGYGVLAVAERRQGGRQL